MSYYFETAGEYYSNCKLYVIGGYEVVKLQASHQRQQGLGRRGGDCNVASILYSTINN